MKNLFSLFVFLGLCATAFFLIKVEMPPDVQVDTQKEENATSNQKDKKQVMTEVIQTSGKLTDHKTEKISLSPAGEHPATNRALAVKINADNFAKELPECFVHHNCTIENPWAIYKKLKETNPDEIESYFTLLRRFVLETPSFRDKHRESIAVMIKDFYPADIEDLKLADFYYFARDLEKSAELYKKVAVLHKKDPNAPAVPDLNYANTLFDMKKYQEALPYYRASRKRLEGNESPDTLEAMNFIDERIEEITSRLNE